MGDVGSLITLAEVRAVAAELPKGSRNPQYGEAGICRYSDPDTFAPSCLVGTIISKVRPEIFAEITDSPHSAWDALDGWADHDSRLWLYEAQTIADRAGACTWGEAIERTDTFMERLACEAG